MSPKPSQNKVLSALPFADWERLSPQLEWLEMPAGTLLHEAGSLLKHVYFPVTAVVCECYAIAHGADATSATPCSAPTPASQMRKQAQAMQAAAVRMSFDVRPARGAHYILATDHELPPLRHKLMQSTQQPCLPYATAADGDEPWRRATRPPCCRAKPAPGPVPALLAKPLPSEDQDWDLMFNAVKARLRAAAQCGQDSASMSGAVLECVEALEQLHRMLEAQRTTPDGR